MKKEPVASPRESMKELTYDSQAKVHMTFRAVNCQSVSVEVRVRVCVCVLEPLADILPDALQTGN